MYEFQSLLSAGAVVAAMSDESDGDCRREGTSGYRDAFLERVGVASEKLYTLRQVHGCQIRVVDAKSAGRGAQLAETAVDDGDGLITATTGIPLGVTVADCVPVLLFDPVTRAIGVFHAGREGTTAAIVLEGLARLTAEFGVNPANVQAVVGPSAGPCCYEVSEEIALRCTQQGLNARGRYLDLWASNRTQLMRGGVKSMNIEISRCCTLCSEGFFSYRRQATKCRNLVVLMA